MIHLVDIPRSSGGGGGGLLLLNEGFGLPTTGECSGEEGEV